MANSARRYLPNSREVAAKVLDGEAILIHLSTGVYYSMDPVASGVWTMIEGGATVDGIVGEVCAACGRPEGEVRPDVEELIGRLEAENLVVAADGPPAGAGSAGSPGSPAGAPAFAGPTNYVKPQLNVYRDMQDLLALDPPMPNIEDLTWDKPK